MPNRRPILGNAAPDAQFIRGKPFYKVAVGFDEGPLYAAYTFGERWNGWATPYFTEDVAKQVAARGNDKKSYMYYEPTLDAWVHHDEYSGPVFDPGDKMDIPGKPYDSIVARGEVINGVKYYPIGAYSFTWDEYDETEGGIPLPYDPQTRKKVDLKQRLSGIRNALQFRSSAPFSRREDDLEYEQAELEEIAKQLGVE